MFEEISARDLRQLQEEKQVTIIDVREINEYEDHHIPDSLHIPLQQIPQALDELDKNETYYMLCHLGQRSRIASQYLEQEGFEVVNIHDGIEGWDGQIESFE